MIKSNPGKSGCDIVGVMPNDQYLVVSHIEVIQSDMRAADLNSKAVHCSYKRVLGFAVTSKESEEPRVLVEHRNNVILFRQEDFAAMVPIRDCFSASQLMRSVGTMDVAGLPAWAQTRVQKAHQDNVVFNWLSKAKGEDLVPKPIAKKMRPRMTRLDMQCASDLEHALHSAWAILDASKGTGVTVEEVAAFLLLSDSRVLLTPPVDVLRAQKKAKQSLFRWLCEEVKDNA